MTGETFSDFAGEDTGPVLTAEPERRRRSTVSRNAHQLSRRGWFDSVTNVFNKAKDTVVNAAKTVAGQISKAATEVKTQWSRQQLKLTTL